jgi:predicted MFS family arabinose efflux permease
VWAATYIVPFLDSVTGISGAPVSLFLLAYGGACAVASFGGPAIAMIAAPVVRASGLLAPPSIPETAAPESVLCGV